MTNINPCHKCGHTCVRIESGKINGLFIVMVSCGHCDWKPHGKNRCFHTKRKAMADYNKQAKKQSKGKPTNER